MPTTPPPHLSKTFLAPRARRKRNHNPWMKAEKHGKKKNGVPPGKPGGTPSLYGVIARGDLLKQSADKRGLLTGDALVNGKDTDAELHEVVVVFARAVVVKTVHDLSRLIVGVILCDRAHPDARSAAGQQAKCPAPSPLDKCGRNV